MLSDGPSDANLVAAYLSRRDEPAFLVLYRRHTPALLGLARRLCAGNGPEAEEVVQEAWARAAGSLGGFASRSSLKTWLSGFVVNVWRERQRLENWRGQGAEDAEVLEIAPAPGPFEPIDMARAIAALPPGYRAVLVLHDVEGFTHEEIAAQLGVEAGTSKSQLTRARMALRARLGAPGRSAAGGRS